MYKNCCIFFQVLNVLNVLNNIQTVLFRRKKLCGIEFQLFRDLFSMSKKVRMTNYPPDKLFDMHRIKPAPNFFERIQQWQQRIEWTQFPLNCQQKSKYTAFLFLFIQKIELIFSQSTLTTSEKLYIGEGKMKNMNF